MKIKKINKTKNQKKLKNMEVKSMISMFKNKVNYTKFKHLK